MTSLGVAPSLTRRTASRRIVSEVSCDSVRPSMRTPLHSTMRGESSLNKGLVSNYLGKSSSVELEAGVPLQQRRELATSRRPMTRAMTPLPTRPVIVKMTVAGSGSCCDVPNTT